MYRQNIVLFKRRKYKRSQVISVRLWLEINEQVNRDDKTMIFGRKKIETGHLFLNKIRMCYRQNLKNISDWTE